MLSIVGMEDLPSYLNNHIVLQIDCQFPYPPTSSTNLTCTHGRPGGGHIGLPGLRMLTNTKGGGARCGRTRPHHRQRRAGFTLIEIGIVVALLGLIAVLVADYYASQLSLRHVVQRVEGTVRDARSIIDASVAWSAVNSDEWPNDRAVLAPVIELTKLVEEGYLIRIPDPRYAGCAQGCRGFAITGWDRAAARVTVPATPCAGPLEHTLLIASGNYDANPAADDLVLCFDVRGTSDARAVASRLPQGRLYQTVEQIGTDAYRVEARVLGTPPRCRRYRPGRVRPVCPTH